MIDFGAWGSAISETMKWLNSSSARKKEASLRAADAYLDIDQTKLYKGATVTEKREKELKTHFYKQFNAWKNG
jgi:hypothetical protein